MKTAVDGIIVFSINFIDQHAPTVPLFETLQQISTNLKYPGIVPGFVDCANTPESLLEMKGVMKHVMKDWVTHLLMILEQTTEADEPFEMIMIKDHQRVSENGEGRGEEEDDGLEDDISELTEMSLLSPGGAATPNGGVAGLQTSAQQQSREKDILGSRKKKGTGGGSTIVLG
jgi:hypothetical protein